MDNLYYGDILRCTIGRTPLNEEQGILTSEGNYLIEISEGKFVLLEELLSNKKPVRFFNLYSFNRGDYYINPLTLVKVEDIMIEKYGRKLK